LRIKNEELCWIDTENITRKRYEKMNYCVTAQNKRIAIGAFGHFILILGFEISYFSVNLLPIYLAIFLGTYLGSMIL